MWRHTHSHTSNKSTTVHKYYEHTDALWFFLYPSPLFPAPAHSFSRYRRYRTWNTAQTNQTSAPPGLALLPSLTIVNGTTYSGARGRSVGDTRLLFWSWSAYVSVAGEEAGHPHGYQNLASCFSELRASSNITHIHSSATVRPCVINTPCTHLKGDINEPYKHRGEPMKSQ